MPPISHGNRDPQFFTPKEAAAYLGVTVITVYHWIQKPRGKGRLPARDFGSKKRPCYRIPKDRFIAWANAGTED